MNRFFIKALRFVVNAAWYLLFPLIAVVLFAVIYKIATQHYVDMDVPVRMKEAIHLPALQPADSHYTYTGIKQVEVVLKFKASPTPPMIAILLVSLVCGILPVFGILYQSRRILNSLKADTPFAYGNIKRLRLISLFILLLAVAKWLNSAGNIMFFNSQFSKTDTIYWPRAEFSVWPIIASIIVFVLSEVFRQGYQLKTDNESFI